MKWSTIFILSSYMKFFPVFSLLKYLFSLISNESSESLLLKIDLLKILSRMINTLVLTIIICLIWISNKSAFANYLLVIKAKEKKYWTFYILFGFNFFSLSSNSLLILIFSISLSLKKIFSIRELNPCFHRSSVVSLPLD